MDLPSTPQSLQNAGVETATQVNNETIVGANKISCNSAVTTVIDEIDLEDYDQKKELLWVGITRLCQQLQSEPTCLRDQIKIFKEIQTNYVVSSKIVAEPEWKYILQQYTRATQTFSYVSVSLSQLSR